VGGMAEAVLEVAVERPAERRERVGRGRTPSERPVEGGEALVDHPVDERPLVAEVMVDGGRGHVRTAADLAGGEAVLPGGGWVVCGGGQDGGAGGGRRTAATSEHARRAGHEPL